MSKPGRIKLIPLVLVAIIGLFALKTLGLVFNGGYTLGDRVADGSQDQSRTGASSGIETVASTMVKTAPDSKQSWAQSMFNYPDITGSTGHGDSGGGSKPASEPIPLKVTDKPPPAVAGTTSEGDRPVPPGERAVLERLNERRQELDARSRELEMRESLIKAAEKRLEGKVNELKDAETRISGAVQKRDEAETTRFKTLVTMYENMKPKDAARIFDRLDIRILIDVASQINPRKMSDILASMSADAAERLTVELANRAGAAGGPELPKIEGRPTGN